MADEHDKSDQQEAAEAEVAEFREKLGPFVVAAETTRMAMIFTDAKEADNPIIFANDSFLKMTGYRRDEVLGRSFNFLMARGTDADAISRIESEFGGGSDDDLEIRYRRKDGSQFWATLFINPVRDESGDIVQHFASFVDITRHREESDHATMLIDELNHRVKNTLSTVQSIVAQGLRNATDPADAREAIEARLSALSRSHDLLTRQNWESAALRDVVHAALEPFGITNGRAEHFTVDGPNVHLPPKAVLALGVAFHELATNAAKYGAFSNAVGCIRVEWTIEPDPNGDRLVLCWREDGGPPVTAPSRRGFGSRVIEQGLPHELGGTAALDYRPNGVVCSIDIPLPRGIRVE